jgi:hypothetical protein
MRGALRFHQFLRQNPRTATAVHFGLVNFPVAYCGLKIITSLALRFPDFQRKTVIELKPKDPKASKEMEVLYKEVFGDE